MWRGQPENIYNPPSLGFQPNNETPGIKSGEIKSFYEGVNLFITGGTGFLGKVVIEKLLRSCPGLNCIYILMRPKKGLNSEQRFEEFQKHEVFNRIRGECPKVLSKLMVISGDMGSVGMGLSVQDDRMLVEQVSVVFHVAATVKFNEDMKDAADLNTLGTVQMMEFCSRIKNLKSVVHVSTAYCNPQVDVVEEQVYETTEPVSKESFLALVKALPKPLMNLVGEKIQVTISSWNSVDDQEMSFFSGLPSKHVHPDKVHGRTIGSRVQHPIPHLHRASIDRDRIDQRTVSRLDRQYQWNHRDHDGDWSGHNKQHHVRTKWRHGLDSRGHCQQYDYNGRLVHASHAPAGIADQSDPLHVGGD